MAFRLALNTRTVLADALGTLADAGAGTGTIKLYTGAQP